MAKQIIVLDRTDTNTFNVAFWLAVPTTRQPFYANSAATSTYKSASAAELTAIQSGAVVEQVDNFAFIASQTIASIMSFLQTEFTARQLVITNANPWNRYGSFFDGATWTAGGVA